MQYGVKRREDSPSVALSSVEDTAEPVIIEEPVLPP